MVSLTVEFDNTSPFAVWIFKGEPEPQIMLATVVVKVAYEVTGDGVLCALGPEEATIRDEPDLTELGILPSDQVPSRPGVNVFVHAFAHAPRAAPTKAMKVALQVGPLHHVILVIGDRIWSKGDRISGPEEFTTMPLTYQRAYGGLADYQDGQVAFPDNVEGRGFVCDASTMVGTALPNLENPTQRIATWKDQPCPQCWAPLPPQSGLHLRRAVDVLDADALAYRLTKQTFNCAHPDLALAELEPGARGVIRGVTPSGEFAFTVPQEALRVEVELAPRRFELTPVLDTLGLFPEQQRLVASFRASFRYRLQPKQARVTRVSLAP